MLLSINIGEAKNFSKIPSVGFIGLISPCKEKGNCTQFSPRKARVLQQQQCLEAVDVISHRRNPQERCIASSRLVCITEHLK